MVMDIVLEGCNVKEIVEDLRLFAALINIADHFILWTLNKMVDTKTCGSRQKTLRAMYENVFQILKILEAAIQEKALHSLTTSSILRLMTMAAHDTVFRNHAKAHLSHEDIDIDDTVSSGREVSVGGDNTMSSRQHEQNRRPHDLRASSEPGVEPRKFAEAHQYDANLPSIKVKESAILWRRPVWGWLRHAWPITSKTILHIQKFGRPFLTRMRTCPSTPSEYVFSHSS
jgi:hypothetical protein